MSVLLPVYNGADTLPAALDSLAGQTLADHEVIAVDDGSRDRTAALLQKYAARDARVRPVTLPRNEGIVPALTAAVSAARADALARMDADDLCTPHRLEAQWRFLAEHPDVGLVGSRVRFGGDRQAQAGYAAYVAWTNGLLSHEELALNRFVESPFAHPSVMYRREVVTTHGGYRDGPFPEDYELWLRWLEAGVRMAKLPEVLLTWNDPPDRLSRTDRRYDRRAFYACKAEYLAAWLARHNPHHPDLVVWGAGRETRKRAELLIEHGVRISAYIDIDPRRIGQVIHHRPVLDADHLPDPDAAFIAAYVGSRGARDDIRQRLAAKGWCEGINFIAAA